MLGGRLATVRHYRSGSRAVPLDRLGRLLRMSSELPPMLEEWRVADHAAVEAEFERRSRISPPMQRCFETRMSALALSVLTLRARPDAELSILVGKPSAVRFFDIAG